MVADGEKTWDIESLSKFGAQVGFDAESDIVVFLIGMHFQADNFMEITYQQFENGCKSLGADDANSWKSVIPGLRQ